ncbi:hypothetical protein DPMN_084617 [Dreissena polymorpha]|uniref:N-acetyltransferase domain-containing protein n=1 Tax=Dreissena polymorpha TaxID=45954 RepID=A0A9D3YBB3_DREPO|nr:hypothetical protein DPMN_084617 [Dreissena polymorpha]
MILYQSGDITVKLEERNNNTRGKFRNFSRQVAGEVFDVPENNQVIFAYKTQYTNLVQTGQMCFSCANLNMKNPETLFDSEYYPQVAFLFVHRDFHCQGFGKLLLSEGLKIIKTMSGDRPVRLQSAWNAVGFFEKFGFHMVAKPFETMHGGSNLFKFMVNMEMS